jgi:hypothetical protein
MIYSVKGEGVEDDGLPQWLVKHGCSERKHRINITAYY